MPLPRRPQKMDSVGQSTVWKTIKPFANGGMSGMAATCIIQPIDMVKVRIQLGATGSPVSDIPCCQRDS